MLAPAGVLELVDQKVMDAVGKGEGGVGGQTVVTAKDALGDLCDFDEVDRAGFGKDHLELGGGVAQESETGADDLPFVFGVAERGEAADRGEGGFKAGDCIQLCDQGPKPYFTRFSARGGREATMNVETFLRPPLAFLGLKEARKFDEEVFGTFQLMHG